MRILIRGNIKEEGIPRSSDLVEDFLLVIGDVTTIQVIVRCEIVILIRCGRVACSHLCHYWVT